MQQVMRARRPCWDRLVPVAENVFLSFLGDSPVLCSGEGEIPVLYAE